MTSSYWIMPRKKGNLKNRSQNLLFFTGQICYVTKLTVSE